MAESNRMSNGGRINDVLEVGISSDEKIMVNDNGVRPHQPFIQGAYRAGKVIQRFLLRLRENHKSPQYLVPMDSSEYFDYCNWKDSRKVPPSEL